MTSNSAEVRGMPALFRAGDIGVSSEWRDISYDWPPVLTAAGVSIYSYLRDTYDHQRSLRPFILNPDGPTKTLIQQLLGYRTSWAIQGPEYLLSTVGLLHVEVGYGQSLDPERPKRTRVAYYVVGRLDHPVLDWSMLDRLLDALIIALDEPENDQVPAERQRKAKAALRSLAQAGMFQNIDPEDLFYPYGAWPGLLPTLVEDERWVTLFAHLHGVDTVSTYRRQARAWVEYVQRTAARLMQENRAIGDQLLAAQRRGPRGGGSPTENMTQPPGPAIESPGAFSHNPVTEAVRVTQTASVAGESLASRQAVRVTQTASATSTERSHGNAAYQAHPAQSEMSLARDQLINSSRNGAEGSSFPATNLATSDRATEWKDINDLPVVEPHLQDAELASTRQDAYFWCAVQQILYGNNNRYDHTPGEKQAALRHFKKTNTPIGVILAALRAVMTLPPSQRPRRFSDALKLDIFHACVQQALALLPARKEAAAAASTWLQFLQAYRSIGQTNQLRDVSTSDYHVLYALFVKQPNECWDVLNRVEHAAQLPDLSPAYLRRAIVNNQRAAAQQALLSVEQRAACGQVASRPAVVQVGASEQLLLSDDPRHLLLKQEGVPAEILTEDITEEYIRHWIAEADARHEEIYSRPGWLKWGIESGYTPLDHPQLRLRSKQSGLSSARNHSPLALCNALSEPASEVDSALHTFWQAALSILEAKLPRNEFETWIKPCQLVAVEPDARPDEATGALVATPNIFVRQELEGRYLRQVEEALGTALGYPVQVQPVIGHIPHPT
ncbi:MAG: hypothetical protein M3R24_39530 [Chloroflexota bacterium]|nr:hypothetical protein [Chloroflexota bacterium]